MYEFRHGCWYREKDYPKNPYPLLQLSLSTNEGYVIGTHRVGFELWNIQVCNTSTTGEGCTSLKLPPGVRNIATKMNKAMPCVLSAHQKYAITGIRKELYIWSVDSGELVKTLDAHFGRIIDLQPLTIGSWNCVITSSIDRTVKVWNINYIFEQVHHIDRHEQERSCLAWAPVMAMLRRPSSAPSKRWPPFSSLFLHSFVFVFGHHFRLCFFAPLNFFRRFVLWRTTTQPCWWFWAARLQSLGKTSTAPALR